MSKIMYIYRMILLNLSLNNYFNNSWILKLFYKKYLMNKLFVEIFDN